MARADRDEIGVLLVQHGGDLRDPVAVAVLEHRFLGVGRHVRILGAETRQRLRVAFGPGREQAVDALLVFLLENFLERDAQRVEFVIDIAVAHEEPELLLVGFEGAEMLAFHFRGQRVDLVVDAFRSDEARIAALHAFEIHRRQPRTHIDDIGRIGMRLQDHVAEIVAHVLVEQRHERGAEWQDHVAADVRLRALARVFVDRGSTRRCPPASCLRGSRRLPVHVLRQHMDGAEEIGRALGTVDGRHCRRSGQRVRCGVRERGRGDQAAKVHPEDCGAACQSPQPGREVRRGNGQGSPLNEWTAFGQSRRRRASAGSVGTDRDGRARPHSPAIRMATPCFAQARYEGEARPPPPLASRESVHTCSTAGRDAGLVGRNAEPVVAHGQRTMLLRKTFRRG